jgi:hypothetical protein
MKFSAVGHSKLTYFKITMIHKSNRPASVANHSHMHGTLHPRDLVAWCLEQK